MDTADFLILNDDKISVQECYLCMQLIVRLVKSEFYRKTKLCP